MDKKYGIEKDVEDNNEDYIENNNEKKCQILNIDIGNGKIEQLKIYNYHNPKKDVYDFCMKNNLDYNTMEEINKQLNESIFKNINEDNNTKKKSQKEILYLLKIFQMKIHIINPKEIIILIEKNFIVKKKLSKEKILIQIKEIKIINQKKIYSHIK